MVGDLVVVDGSVRVFALAQPVVVCPYLPAALVTPVAKEAPPLEAVDSLRAIDLVQRLPFSGPLTVLLLAEVRLPESRQKEYLLMPPPLSTVETESEY